MWSISRKCLVGENGVEPLELLDDGDGNLRLSIENNRMVSMQNRIKINADEINNSNGIIISSETGTPYYRFQFIPTT